MQSNTGEIEHPDVISVLTLFLNKQKHYYNINVGLNRFSLVTSYSQIQLWCHMFLYIVLNCAQHNIGIVNN